MNELSCQLTIELQEVLFQRPKRTPCFLFVYQGEKLIAMSPAIQKGAPSALIKDVRLEYHGALRQIQAQEIEFQVVLKSTLQRRVTSRGRLLLSSLQSGREQIGLVSPSKTTEAWIKLKVQQKLFPRTETEGDGRFPIGIPDELEQSAKASMLEKLEHDFQKNSQKKEWNSSPEKLWKLRLMKFFEKQILKAIEGPGYLAFFDSEIRMNSSDEKMYYYLTPRVAESKFYVFGDDQHRNLYEFNFAVEKFKKIEKPQNIFMFGYSMSCALPNGKLMITGGINKSLNVIVSTAYWYDPIKNKIELLSDMKQSRYTHTICYHDGYVYVIGGRYYGKEKDGVLAHMERYCVARNVWENLKPMKEKRCTAAAVVFKEHMYVFGGYQGAGRVNTIDKYDMAADEWEKLPMAMPQSIEAGCAFLCSNEGKIVYFAGKEDKTNSFECIVYDVVHNTYEKQQKLNAGRVLPRCTLYKDTIYVFGGAGMTWEKAEINKWNWTSQGSYIDSVNSEMKLFSSAAKKEMLELAPNELLEPFPVFLSGESASSKLDLVFLKGTSGNPANITQSSFSYEYRNNFRLNTKEASCSPAVLGYIHVVGGVDSLGNVLRDSHLVNHEEMRRIKEDPKRIGLRIISLVPTQSMWHERRKAASCAFSCFNYVFGGVNKYGETWRSGERFDFEANEWHPIMDMPLGLHSAKATQANDDLIALVGGMTDSDGKIPNKRVLLYSVSRNAWKVIEKELPAVLFLEGQPNLISFGGSIWIFSKDCGFYFRFCLKTEDISDTSPVETGFKFSQVYSVFLRKEEIKEKIQSASESEKELEVKDDVQWFLRIFGKPSGSHELHVLTLEFPSLKSPVTEPVPFELKKENEAILPSDLDKFIVCPFSPYQKTAHIDAISFLNLQLVNNSRRSFIFTKDTKTNKSCILAYSYLSETFQAISPPSNFIHFEGSSAASLSDGTILISGGVLPSSRSLLIRPDSFVFSPFSNTWTKTSAMKFPRTNHALVPFQGKIMAIGGQSKANYSSSALSSTEIFSNSEWHEGALLNTGRHSFGCIEMPNAIYVLGGRGVNGEALDSVERFSPDLGTWEICENKLPYQTALVKAVSLSYNEALILSSSDGSDEGGFSQLFLVEFQNPKSFAFKKSFKTLFLYKDPPQFSIVGNNLFLIGGNRAGKSEKVSMDVNGVTESGFFEIPSYDNLVNGHLAGATSAISEVDYCQTSYKVSEKNSRFLYIFGTDSNPIIEKLDLETMRWFDVPKPSNLTIWDYSIALTLPNGQIFICGGINSQLTNIKSSAFLVTPENGENKMTCEVLPEMHQDRYTHTCGFLNNYVYVMGGRNFGNGLQGVLEHCERLNLRTKKWEKIAPLKAKRCTATAFSFKNSIYIVGGFRGDGRVKCIERYNEALDEWMSVPLLLYHPVEAQTMIHLSNKEILLLGGKDDFAEQQYISLYNFERNTCTMMKPEKFMTATRVLAKSAKYKDQILVIGGNQSLSSEQASIWELKWGKFNNSFKLINNSFTRTAFAQSY